MKFYLSIIPLTPNGDESVGFYLLKFVGADSVSNEGDLLHAKSLELWIWSNATFCSIPPRRLVSLIESIPDNPDLFAIEISEGLLSFSGLT